MPAYFLDSSAFAKRFMLEVGTPWTEGICNPGSGNDIFLARITATEVASALARSYREGRLTQPQYRSAVDALRNQLGAGPTLLEITPSVIAISMQLVDKYPLKAYDSIQLAVAVATQQIRVQLSLPGLVFVSADSKLNTAAQGEGFSVDDPNAHP